MVTNWRTLYNNPELVRVLHNAYQGGGEWSLTPQSITGVGTRAANPITAAQLVDWELTGFLLRSGPISMVDVGVQLFPVVPVERYIFKIGKLGNVALFPGQIERPAGAAYNLTRPLVTGAPSEAKRYGRAGWIDRDELTNQSATFPALSMVAARQAQEETLRGLDQIKAAIVANTANYAQVIVGSSWTVDGSMRDQINAAAATITANTGMPKSAFTLCLFNTIDTVATSDALFLERRRFGTNGAIDPTLADVQAYLGVKDVIHINAVGQSAEGATPSYIFPSHAVLFYQGNPSELVTAPPELGIRCWGRSFRIPGVASLPFFENMTTKWIFPYDMREVVGIQDPGCAVLITSPQ